MCHCMRFREQSERSKGLHYNKKIVKLVSTTPQARLNHALECNDKNSNSLSVQRVRIFVI